MSFLGLEFSAGHQPSIGSFLKHAGFASKQVGLGAQVDDGVGEGLGVIGPETGGTSPYIGSDAAYEDCFGYSRLNNPLSKEADETMNTNVITPITGSSKSKGIAPD